MIITIIISIQTFWHFRLIGADMSNLEYNTKVEILEGPATRVCIYCPAICKQYKHFRLKNSVEVKKF